MAIQFQVSVFEESFEKNCDNAIKFLQAFALGVSHDPLASLPDFNQTVYTAVI